MTVLSLFTSSLFSASLIVFICLSPLFLFKVVADCAKNDEANQFAWLTAESKAKSNIRESILINQIPSIPKLARDRYSLRQSKRRLTGSMNSPVNVSIQQQKQIHNSTNEENRLRRRNICKSQMIQRLRRTFDIKMWFDGTLSCPSPDTWSHSFVNLTHFLAFRWLVCLFTRLGSIHDDSHELPGLCV